MARPLASGTLTRWRRVLAHATAVESDGVRGPDTRLEVLMPFRLLTVAFGAALLGGWVATAVKPVAAEPAQVQPRLVVVPARIQGTAVPGRFAFIRDTQSGACWLSVANPSGDVALASAPTGNCEPTK